MMNQAEDTSGRRPCMETFVHFKKKRIQTYLDWHHCVEHTL